MACVLLDTGLTTADAISAAPPGAGTPGKAPASGRVITDTAAYRREMVRKPRRAATSHTDHNRKARMTKSAMI